MTEQKTKEYYVQKANQIHGNAYNYEKYIFVNTRTKSIVTCNDHGDFLVSFASHVYGKTGCYECGRNCQRYKTTKTQEEFVNECVKVHGDKYFLDEVVYTNARCKITPICKVHGKWSCRASAFTSGNGCPKCGRAAITSSITMKQDDFIRHCDAVHNSIYDLSKVVYGGMCNKITPVCNKHGIWSTSAHSFYRGNGCPRCSSSKGEKYIAEFLDSISIKYIRQKMYKDCRGKKYPLRFDFFLPYYNVIIEYDGEQHYRFDNKGWNTEEKYIITKRYDSIKTRYCDTNNITLIRILYSDDKSIVRYKIISVIANSKILTK